MSSEKYLWTLFNGWERIETLHIIGACEGFTKLKTRKKSRHGAVTVNVKKRTKLSGYGIIMDLTAKNNVSLYNGTLRE